jgi:hypothetical protein
MYSQQVGQHAGPALNKPFLYPAAWFSGVVGCVYAVTRPAVGKVSAKPHAAWTPCLCRQPAVPGVHVQAQPQLLRWPMQPWLLVLLLSSCHASLITHPDAVFNPYTPDMVGGPQ